MKEFYIIRGIPGCGKSTLANVLAANCDSVICCADDYFRGTDGSYNFIPEYLGEAHSQCQAKARKGISENKERIIIDNVNATTAQLMPYIEMAEKANYRVISLIVEHRHQEINRHHVPEHSRRRMAEQMLSHIKLIFSRS
jgi:adenylate kinase family enzyme